MEDEKLRRIIRCLNKESHQKKFFLYSGPTTKEKELVLLPIDNNTYFTLKILRSC